MAMLTAENPAFGMDGMMKKHMEDIYMMVDHGQVITSIGFSGMWLFLHALISKVV